MYRPEITSLQGMENAQEQLRGLGQMKGQEKKFIAVMLLLILACKVHSFSTGINNNAPIATNPKGSTLLIQIKVVQSINASERFPFSVKPSGVGRMSNYPQRDDQNWLGWIKIRQENGNMKLHLEPVPLKTYKHPVERYYQDNFQFPTSLESCAEMAEPSCCRY